MTLQARALVTSKWLAEAMKVQGKMRILDTSWYLPKLRRSAKSEFKKRHITGAAFFDIDQCCDKTSPLDHMLPSEKFFADYVGNLGIESDTHVVVYDTSDFGAFSAPRVWWMFRVFGHSSVSLLNGGLRNWEMEERPVSDQYVRPTSTEFKASVNRSWIKTYQDILDNLYTKKFQVVDARPAGRFRGLDPEPRDNTEPGHIPGSISMPFHSFLSESGHFPQGGTPGFVRPGRGGPQPPYLCLVRFGCDRVSRGTGSPRMRALGGVGVRRRVVGVVHPCRARACHI